MNKSFIIILFLLSSFTFGNAQTTINFSGYTWNVKHSTSPVGPGPNIWDKDNVWLDGNGNLHLAIKKNPSTGVWSCAEVYTQNTFASGTYQFWVEGRVDLLDKNVVFGMFDYKGPDGFDENDIEYAKWGNNNADILNYTVYPAYGTNGVKETKHYPVSLNGTYTTQRFTRKYDNIFFQSLGGFYDNNTNQYASYTFTNNPIILSKTNMPVHINLWLFNGVPPSNANNVEIIIHQFKYTSDNCPESYEPNDASTIAPSLFNPPLNQTSASTVINSIISAGSDQDWYKIPIDATGTLNVTLTNLPANYDMELYPSNGLPGGALAGSYNTGTTNETITYNYTTPASTHLYVKVYPNNNSQYSQCNTYKLTANWTPSQNTSPPGPFTLTVTPECNGTTSQIRLNWTVSNNATSYDIYRNGNFYTTVTSGTQFINSAVTSGTSYSYFVKAVNTGGATNNSNGTLSATAPNCSSPTSPGPFTLLLTPECNGTASQIRLNWTASANATSYDIYRNNVLYATGITGTQFINTSVTPGTIYTYYVQARNSAGNTNNSNGTLSATAPNCSSTTSPGPFTLMLTPECNGNTSQIRLNWSASNNASNYTIYKNGAAYYSTNNSNQFIDNNVSAGSSYTYYAVASNSFGNTSNSNGILSATALNCSGSSSPGTFTLSVTPQCNGTASQIRLNWSVSSNATYYTIYRDGIAYYSTNNSNQFIDNNVSAGNSYTYYVVASNSFGNTSNSNGILSATALNCSGSSAPGSFTLAAIPQCTGTTSQIRLNWSYSNNATNYTIYRNGIAYFGTNNTTQFIDNNVTVGVSYNYYAVASNSFGNTNNSNGQLSVTAINCSGSSSPGAFTLSVTPQCNGTTSQIRLNWSYSNNATNYTIYRNGIGYFGTNNTNQFIDNNISVGISYTYYAVANNPFGNTNNTNGPISVTAINCSGSSSPGSFTLAATPQCNGTSSQIRLNWSASNNATDYTIYRNGIAYFGTNNTNQFIDNNVSPGSSYEYYAIAHNSVGNTSNSNGVLYATPINCSGSSSPGSFFLTVTPQCFSGDSEIKLSWTPSNNAYYYDIYRNGFLDYSGFTGTSIRNIAVTPGVTYSYFVKAINSFGSINNNNGSISATAPNCNGNVNNGPDNPYEINVFPNPSSGMYNLTAKNIYNREISIEVYNNYKHLLYYTEPSTSTNNLTQSINITNEPNGIYFVRITIDQNVYFRQLVKQ